MAWNMRSISCLACLEAERAQTSVVYVDLWGKQSVEHFAALKRCLAETQLVQDWAAKNCGLPSKTEHIVKCIIIYLIAKTLNIYVPCYYSIHCVLRIQKVGMNNRNILITRTVIN